MIKKTHSMFLEDYVPRSERERLTEMVAFTVTPSVKAMLEKWAWEYGASLSHFVRCLVERGGVELLKDEAAAEKEKPNDRDPS